MEIKNQRIKSYYESQQRIYRNAEFKKDKRMKALEKLELVERFVLTYEYGEVFDLEDELRESYKYRMLPEDIEEFLNRVNQKAGEGNT